VGLIHFMCWRLDFSLSPKGLWPSICNLEGGIVEILNKTE
jgi:hypothetical protein